MFNINMHIYYIPKSYDEFEEVMTIALKEINETFPEIKERFILTGSGCASCYTETPTKEIVKN